MCSFITSSANIYYRVTLITLDLLIEQSILFLWAIFFLWHRVILTPRVNCKSVKACLSHRPVSQYFFHSISRTKLSRTFSRGGKHKNFLYRGSLTGPITIARQARYFLKVNENRKVNVWKKVDRKNLRNQTITMLLYMVLVHRNQW